MPKVSALIPSYNHAKFIGEAIQSVLDQTFQDFEIIIKDDGSSDNSLEVIRSFNDSRIHLEVNKCNHWSGTHNDLIILAKGEYLALLNSDDVWMLDKLEKQVKFLDENPQYAAVFSDAQAISEAGNNLTDTNHFYYSIFNQPNRTRTEWLKYFLYQGNCICHPSMLIRAHVYEEIGLYNQLMGALPDMDMWIRLCSNYEIHILPEKLIKFRILNGEKNASGNNTPNILRGYYDHGKLFDSFAKLKDIKLFNSIFLDYHAQFIEEIPIKLALNLLEDNRIFAQVWAINKIYDLLYSDYQYYSQFITAKEFKLLLGKTDIYDVFGARGTVVHLFYDNGCDFNGEQYLQQNVAVGKNSYSFSLQDLSGITRLRFDPINQPAKVKLLSAYAKLDNGENYPLELVWHNGDLHTDIYDFRHDDPQMVFDIPEAIKTNLVSVKFEVEITPYSKLENLQLLTNSRNESYAISQQLVTTQQQLQQAEQQAHQLNPWSHAVVALHYDIGQDFNAEHYLQQAAKVGLKHYEFSLSEIAGIEGVRLDPLNLPAHIKLILAQIVTKDGVFYPLSVAWHNANHLAENSYSFYHDDPIWIFDWSSLGALDYDKVVLEFEPELINVHELSNFIIQQTMLLNSRNIELSNRQSELSNTQSELSNIQSELSNIQSELSNTQSELSNIQSELSNTQSELSNTQSELSNTQSELQDIYNSKSWKITKPLRRLLSVFRK
jgi:glycosyltransferase involved in cell wall biosynthesis